MSNDQQVKKNIGDALKSFSSGNLTDKANDLFATMGYSSEKRPSTISNSPYDFLNAFNTDNRLNNEKAHVNHWKTITLLFQLTKDEIKKGSQLVMDFGTGKKVDNTIIESYLFFALELKQDYYTRTQLAAITREINKLFPMPCMVLFHYRETLTLSIINRRLHKQDESRDVLEKVTLIKDINLTNTHRAHIEILFDLTLDELYRTYGFSNFVELHRAWQKALDSSELNKRFFAEIANWYFWAIKNVSFPKGAAADVEVQNATSVIRLITRLIFIWFIKEKHLVPEELFDQRKLSTILIYEDPKNSIYYKAILQNLFFATLNQEMNTPKKADNRKFRSLNKTLGGRDAHYNITNLYRYEKYFKNPPEALALFSNIPFLNGGLFECLDKPDKDDPSKILRIDGFSDRSDNELRVPDYLFFSEEQDVDLNYAYGTKNKRYKVRGLIDILNRYKFTISENTPIEEEVALDPELLGKVFENLLANYNPETRSTARKQTGSYYTPREIVNYMVDEALISYLENQLQRRLPALASMTDLSDLLREVFAYTEKKHPFNEEEVTAIIDAIHEIKVLDPACGSGAFPMGVLHKLVYILNKLDPHNKKWKNKQIAKAAEITDNTIREKAILEIEETFERNELDYGRKLYLIENCIYGVDIQPIAVQIAKLRFFISLVVDQRIDERLENRGIIPLPNLETKFVAANTLLGIIRPQQYKLRSHLIEEQETALENIRKQHFNARTLQRKITLRENDKKLREELSEILKNDGFSKEATKKIAFWDPYEQNTSADFFDSEWMFGITDGFNVVIANPPYINALEFTDIYGATIREILNANYESARGAYDIFVIFMEKGVGLLAEHGTLSFITPNKYLSAKYAVALREYLIDNGSLVHLVDLSSIKVFNEVSVYPVISIILKGNLQKPTRILLPNNRHLEQFQVSDYSGTIVRRDMLKALPEHIWGFLLSNNVDLLTTLVEGNSPLKEFGSINATSTAAEADTYGRYITNRCQSNSKRILNTGTIDRFTSFWGVSDMTHGGNRFLTPYLPLHEAGVNARRTYIYNAPKIIFAKMARQCEAFIDVGGEYASVNTNCFYNPIQGYSLKFIGAFCNSKLFAFLYQQFFGALRMGGGYYQFQAPQLRVIPLRKANPDQQDAIVAIVDKILALKSKDVHAKTDKMEYEIDALFYALYCLTEKQIKIIEKCAQ